MQKKKYQLFVSGIIILALGIFLILQITNSWNASSEFIENVSIKEANKILAKQNANQNFMILDVRTPQEYAQGHIDNAINIDIRNENFRSELNLLDKNKTYLVYCGSGARSSESIMIMKDVGFTKIYHMHEGFNAWKERK